ncbi:alpha/beta hydrolase family esterase [Winogradskyella sp. R77965]|uniref:alpha/beta hydrolase family esterase n=1 Tax=Winogradskyella sp. R77965 TaxID=3093872 RepID=UPI0037DC6763
MKRLVLLMVTIFAFLSCQKDGEVRSNATNDYEIGKNRFTLNSNGDVREYYVHLPVSYNESEAIPVVFMLHGSSGDGERFYNISGWKEVGEIENILTIFPSSWEYCKQFPNGSQGITTKWNIYADDASYCPGQNPRDDIHFLRDIIDQLNEKFNIDSRRTYLVGFSNGGAMALRCAMEMSDIFAAVVESAGSTSIEATYLPNRNIPVTYQIGNANKDGVPPLPMQSLDSLLNTSPFKRTIATHINSFDLESTYTLSGDSNDIITATYKGISDSVLEFNVRLIKDLEHNYPNGINHPMKGAEVNWEWLKQFSLPE